MVVGLFPTRQFRHGHVGHLYQVLRGELELEPPHAGAHVDELELLAGGVDVGGEGFLHANR